MQLITPYTNVYFDDNSTFAFDQLSEREYLTNVLQKLDNLLGERFNDFCFIIFASIGKGPQPASIDPKFSNKKKVLFYISDETGRSADDLAGYFHCIYKSYLPANSNKNVYPFPLGYVNGIRFAAGEVKNIRTRTTGVFFSGNLNNNRIELFKRFSSINISSVLIRYLIKVPFIKKQLVKTIRQDRLPGSFINFTPFFKLGLSPESYKHSLLNSKIVFCPKGFDSAETYRHFEAMAAGCIVISEKLPSTSLYTSSPIIQVNDWKEGIAVAKKLLGNGEQLEQLQKTSLDFWRDNYSESAIAANIKLQLLKIA